MIDKHQDIIFQVCADIAKRAEHTKNVEYLTSKHHEVNDKPTDKNQDIILQVYADIAKRAGHTSIAEILISKLHEVNGPSLRTLQSLNDENQDIILQVYAAIGKGVEHTSIAEILTSKHHEVNGKLTFHARFILSVVAFQQCSSTALKSSQWW